MEAIYELVASRIQEKVPAIRWIDLDCGQVDYQEYRAAVEFPALLVSVSLAGCRQMGQRGTQLCQATVQLRLVCMVFDDTNIGAPELVREAAMEPYRIAGKIQEALQWWQPPNGNDLGRFNRANLAPEKRDDGLTVLTMNYDVAYTDNRVASTAYQEITALPKVTRG